jgi:hypothetical protein
MKVYTVTVKTVYIQEMNIMAEDSLEAERVAREEFAPDPDCIYSMDVFGPDLWEPDSELEDILHDQYVQTRIDSE